MPLRVISKLPNRVIKNCIDSRDIHLKKKIKIYKRKKILLAIIKNHFSINRENRQFDYNYKIDK
jgi:hypothetical protein